MTATYIYFRKLEKKYENLENNFNDLENNVKDLQSYVEDNYIDNEVVENILEKIEYLK